MKKLSLFRRAKSWIVAHKIATGFIILILGGISYYTYGKITAANAAPQYLLTMARLGSIRQTVTGSGQVSAENQLDIASEVSGTITKINASVGQTVHAGDLIVTLDAKDALVNLENARIAYAKLTKPAKQGDLTNAENTLAKSYNDGFAAVTQVYLDLPALMTGAKSMLYDINGFLSDQTSSYLTSSGRSYRDIAGQSYDKAAAQYQITLTQYKNLTRTSATSSIEQNIADTYAMTKLVAVMLQNMQSALTFIVTTQPEYQPSGAAAAATSVNTWSSTITSDISSIVSSRNSIASGANSLSTLLQGAEDLDIQSQRLSLQQAEDSYRKYFIRAPFDGVIGRIPVKEYDRISSGAAVATLSSNRLMTNISLNEVDAVKVKKGNPVQLTFDALSGLRLEGVVDQVDLVGTMSSGVVTYTIRISFTGTDERIRTGMSVDTTIVTQEKNDVLIVPSAAVKGQGARTYVEMVDDAVPVVTATTNAAPALPTATATASSTRTRTSGQLTVSSKTIPRQIPIQVGESDDTSTEIVSGLAAGDKVVMRTIAAGTATAATAAPNIFSAAGGGRQTGGAVRAVTR